MEKIHDGLIMKPIQNEGSGKRARLRPLHTPGILAKWPLIGLLLVILGGIAFGAISSSLLTNGPLIQLDRPVNIAIHTAALQSSPFIRNVMIFGYYLGQHIIIAIGVLLGLY